MSLFFPKLGTTYLTLFLIFFPLMLFAYSEEDYNKIKNRGFFSLSLHLSHADLSSADLSHESLSYAHLYSANLYMANLYSADLYEADLSKADLHSAGLEYSNLFNANLNNANLRCAKLQNAKAQNASFKNCTLRWTNFQGANLTGANFQGAIFRETNLKNTIVKNADFKGARGLLNAQKAYLRANGALNVPKDSYPEELEKEDMEIIVEGIGNMICDGCELTGKLLKAILWDLPKKAVYLCKEPDCG